MNHNQFSITWYPSAATQSSIKACNQIVHKMSVSDRAEAFDEMTVGQDNQTKIVNSMERLTLADQFHCMGNQAVTQGLTELVEVKKWLSDQQDVLKCRWCSSAEQLWEGYESHEKFMGDEPKPRWEYKKPEDKKVYRKGFVI